MYTKKHIFFYWLAPNLCTMYITLVYKTFYWYNVYNVLDHFRLEQVIHTLQKVKK